MISERVSADVLERITDSMAKHLAALKDELTDSFGDEADAAFIVALGVAIATTLSSFSTRAGC